MTIRAQHLDDSGSAANPKEDHLVLGGISLSEAQVDYITREMDALATSISPGSPETVEFHAAQIFRGRESPWKEMAKPERVDCIKKVLEVLASAYDSAKAFACAVHKPSFPAQDPIELAFEDLCSRFDIYLQKRRSVGDDQRGLLILDSSSQEPSLQRLAREFRVQGTRWRSIHRLVDVPLFVDSRASRAVQLADHVAYAVFRRYHASDSSYFDIISGRFHVEGGVVHGLCHKTQNHGCMCIACLSGRTP